MTKAEMIERFLCPGCVAGSDTKCGAYEPNPESEPWGECRGHVLGTFILPMPGNVALGLPKGFNRPGWCSMKERTHSKMLIRVWPSGTTPCWDWLNVPVWAAKVDGFLFVRTAKPRIAEWAVDVIEGGKAADLCPQAIDVTSRMSEYD